MCGRYSLSLKGEKLEKRFNAKALAKIGPRYNAAPSQKLPVITNLEPSSIQLFQWGLVPFWAKEADIGSKLINARAETLFEKPSFRTSAKSKRCLIPADGFFEWKATGKGKDPYRICLRDEALFAFAGLWDSWEISEGMALNSFTIITVGSNELVKSLHDRMPVILPQQREEEWLKPDLPESRVMELLQPYPSDLMKTFPVSHELNRVENDYPDLLLPSSGMRPGQSLSLFS